jgi:hypothetical protein
VKNSIERLEEWKSVHKARSVQIGIDDGYGASCWEVELCHEHGRTIGVEVSFFIGTPHPWVAVVGLQDNDWPGLAATIHAALDAFEAGNYGDNLRNTSHTIG